MIHDSQILDDTRKWWKARNMRGQVAHVPHTIVTPFNYGEAEGNGQFYGQQQSGTSKSRHVVSSSSLPLLYSSLISQNSLSQQDNSSIEQRSPDATDMMRSKHLGKKGEFRYF